MIGRVFRGFKYELGVMWHRFFSAVLRKTKRHPRFYDWCRLCHYALCKPILFCKLISKKSTRKSRIVKICFLKYGEVSLKSSKKPLVSIIIPVYNQFEYTYACLHSIQKFTDDIEYEVIIADDVSQDATKDIKEYIENAKTVRNKKNLGFLKNCNHAAESAKGQYILFLNNDTQVTKGWLSSLVYLIESDEKIGLVGSKLVFPDGVLQEAGGIITQEGIIYNYGKLDNAGRPEYNYVRDVDYISGASIMIRRKLWEEIGGFDERYAPAYCEDSDLAFAVRNKGYRVVYQPKSVVVHFEGKSNGTDENDTSSIKHYQIENLVKLQKKWKNEFEKLPSNNLIKSNLCFRDRIDNKKVVLVIDHYVPEYDKDAGSRTTFQYLKLLVEKGYLVKFLPDNFYRTPYYTDALEQMGVEVLYGDLYCKYHMEWLEINRYNIDAVYMNRPHITIKYIDKIKMCTNLKLIYYGHDLHFLRERREYELTHDKKHLLESEKFKKIELDIMQKVDQVYYPSVVEKKTIEKIIPKVNVKAINAYMFDDIDFKKYDYDVKEGMMFVGGFTHKPNEDAVLWFMKNVYNKLSGQKIPFYIAGSNPSDKIKKLDEKSNVYVKGYISDEELDSLYEKTKLVVVPLRYGAGIKGKVVEAMSKGAVVVTTSVGAEGIVGAEKFLPITDTAKEFIEQIKSLYNDNEKLEKISLAERNYIKSHYSTEKAWEIIKNDFISTNKKGSTL